MWIRPASLTAVRASVSDLSLASGSRWTRPASVTRRPGKIQPKQACTLRDGLQVGVAGLDGRGREIQVPDHARHPLDLRAEPLQPAQRGRFRGLAAIEDAVPAHRGTGHQDEEEQRAEVELKAAEPALLDVRLRGPRGGAELGIQHAALEVADLDVAAEDGRGLVHVAAANPDLVGALGPVGLQLQAAGSLRPLAALDGRPGHVDGAEPVEQEHAALAELDDACPAHGKGIELQHNHDPQEHQGRGIEDVPNGVGPGSKNPDNITKVALICRKTRAPNSSKPIHSTRE